MFQTLAMLCCNSAAPVLAPRCNHEVVAQLEARGGGAARVRFSDAYYAPLLS